MGRGRRSDAGMVKAWEEIFWPAMEKRYCLRHALAAAGIAYDTWYRYRDKNPEIIDERLKRCKEAYVDELRNEIHRRAVEGVEEPVFYQGNIVGYTKRLSDTLLMFETKRFDPAYATERREITGRDGGPVESKAVVSFENPPESVADLVKLIDEDKI